MGARAIANGLVSFGLVSIPVKLYSASQSSESISFNLLHAKCGGRVKQQYICPSDDGEVVSRDDMVKGYEFRKGEYVTFNEQELKAIEEKATQAIQITEFVDASLIDPVFFDKAYYLGPDRGGDRAYQLLSQAMTQSGRWAIAKYAARGKDYLVALRPVENGLVMQQLHYASEVRSFSELDIPKVEVREQELKMALQLAELAAVEEFHPENYRDESRDRLQALIDRKIAGQEITAAPEAEPKGEVIDLMEALRRSLEKLPGKQAKIAVRDRKPAKRAAAPAKIEAKSKRSRAAK